MGGIEGFQDCRHWQKDKKTAAIGPSTEVRKTPITAADLLNDRVVPFFDAKERAALALTDAVTFIADQHVSRAVWDEASAHFEPDELAHLVWAITVINAWNRITITTRMLPAA